MVQFGEWTGGGLGTVGGKKGSKPRPVKGGTHCRVGQNTEN